MGACQCWISGNPGGLYKECLDCYYVSSLLSFAAASVKCECPGAAIAAVTVATAAVGTAVPASSGTIYTIGILTCLSRPSDFWFETIFIVRNNTQIENFFRIWRNLD